MARSQELIRGFIHEGQKKGLFKYVDVELTIATLFGTLSSAINQGALTCSMLKETNLEALYSDQNRERYKQHLKALLHAHLMTAGV
jgi:hypothetical protein